MRYLLDTNIISELVARQPPQPLLAWLDSLEPQAVYLSVISVGEIQKGIAKLPDSEQKQQLTEWLHDQPLVRFADHILTIDTAVMLTWGILTADCEKKGRPLPALDALIAALARHHQCVLVTRNDKDFAATGIAVLNPWRTVP